MELADVEEVFFVAHDLWRNLRRVESEQLRELAARVEGSQTKSGRLTGLGELGDLFPDTDFSRLDQAASDTDGDRFLAATDVPVTHPSFWTDALDLAAG
jgi:hypothetical protein